MLPESHLRSLIDGVSACSKRETDTRVLDPQFQHPLLSSIGLVYIKAYKGLDSVVGTSLAWPCLVSISHAGTEMLEIKHNMMACCCNIKTEYL
jgi:hypothetical protein